MRLEDIGFYTLSDKRAKESSPTSRMMRCEVLITDKCNFSCPYCRGFSDNMPKGNLLGIDVLEPIIAWIQDDLQSIRFSGGEPTVHPRLGMLVEFCKQCEIENIAISTNGSMPFKVYERLISCGVNDFSISLDACCAAFGDRMSGKPGKWQVVVENIERLSALTYVTVGVVITEETAHTTLDIINFAHSLGVSDIRIISAAQYNGFIDGLANIEKEILDAHPILRYRVSNFLSGRNVRGIKETDSHTCGLMFDDSLVVGKYHFPCVIYAREGGAPVGTVGPDMRKDRIAWALSHNTYEDDICRKNCLDICIDYNNKWAEFHN